MESRFPSAHQIRPLEDRVDTQRREIQTLLHENKRLAVAHVVLKQDVSVAHDDLRCAVATAATVKADRDAKVRQIYDRYLELEIEARSTEGLPDELARIRDEVKEIRAERDELSEKLKVIDRARAKLQQAVDLKSEIESMQREIKRGKAAIESERKMHSANLEMSEAMEKHMFSMAREAEILRSQIPGAEN